MGYVNLIEKSVFDKLGTRYILIEFILRLGLVC